MSNLKNHLVSILALTTSLGCMPCLKADLPDSGYQSTAIEFQPVIIQIDQDQPTKESSTQPTSNIPGGKTSSFFNRVSKLMQSEQAMIANLIKASINKGTSNPLLESGVQHKIKELSRSERIKLFNDITDYEIQKDEANNDKARVYEILQKNYELLKTVLPDHEILIPIHEQRHNWHTGSFKIIDATSYNPDQSIAKNAQKLAAAINIEEPNSLIIWIGNYLEQHPTLSNVKALVNDIILSTNDQQEPSAQAIAQLKYEIGKLSLHDRETLLTEMTQKEISSDLSDKQARLLFIKNAEAYQLFLPDHEIIIPIEEGLKNKRDSFQFQIINASCVAEQIDQLLKNYPYLKELTSSDKANLKEELRSIAKKLIKKLGLQLPASDIEKNLQKYIQFLHLRPRLQEEEEESEILEPDTLEPDTQDPEALEPDTLEPEVLQSETLEPELQEPELQEPMLDEPALNELPFDEPTLKEPALDEPALDEPTPAFEEEELIPFKPLVLPTIPTETIELEILKPELETTTLKNPEPLQLPSEELSLNKPVSNDSFFRGSPSAQPLFTGPLFDQSLQDAIKVAQLAVPKLEEDPTPLYIDLFAPEEESSDTQEPETQEPETQEPETQDSDALETDDQNPDILELENLNPEILEPEIIEPKVQEHTLNEPTLDEPMLDEPMPDDPILDEPALDKLPFYEPIPALEEEELIPFKPLLLPPRSTDTIDDAILQAEMQEPHVQTEVLESDTQEPEPIKAEKDFLPIILPGKEAIKEQSNEQDDDDDIEPEILEPEPIEAEEDFLPIILPTEQAIEKESNEQVDEDELVGSALDKPMLEEPTKKTQSEINPEEIKEEFNQRIKEEYNTVMDQLRSQTGSIPTKEEVVHNILNQNSPEFALEANPAVQKDIVQNIINANSQVIDHVDTDYLLTVGNKTPIVNAQQAASKLVYQNSNFIKELNEYLTNNDVDIKNLTKKEITDIQNIIIDQLEGYFPDEQVKKDLFSELFKYIQTHATKIKTGWIIYS